MRPISSGLTAFTLSPRATDRGRAWRRWALAAALVLLPSLVLAACGDDDDDEAATTVNATESDGTIELDRASSSTGDVDFAIKNSGTLIHEFVVLKTDLAEDGLPLNDDKTEVDETASGIEIVGEQEDIPPGADAELTLDDLEDGKYVIICNVPGHYGLGMRTSFVVG